MIVPRLLQPACLIALAAFASMACSPTETDETDFGRVRIVRLPPNANVPDAVVRDGTIHLVYHDADNLYYATSNDAGASFSQAIRINRMPDVALGGLYRGPEITVGATGDVHVVWYPTGNHSETGILYSRLTNGDTEFERPRSLNNRPSDNFSVAASAARTVAAIWIADDLFVEFSNDGGVTFDRQARLGTLACECCATNAVFTDSGDLWVQFRDRKQNHRNMYLAHFPADGSTATSSKLNSDDWLIDACPVSGGSMTIDGDTLWGTWEIDGQVRFSRYEYGSSDPVAQEFIASEKGKFPVIATLDGGPVIAWKVGRDLHWREFSHSGTPLGPEQRITSSWPDRPAAVAISDNTVLLFP
jgi:hypothetical protein